MASWVRASCDDICGVMRIGSCGVMRIGSCGAMRTPHPLRYAQCATVALCSSVVLENICAQQSSGQLWALR